MVQCPICNWKGKEFLPYGKPQRKNARCPICHSAERHRLASLYLKKIIQRNKPLKALHFAPHRAIRKILETYKNITYLSVDINPEKAEAMKKEDITNLSFTDNSFDIIICIHILEHITEDKKAITELYRVLKSQGHAIIMVPVSNIPKTIEDPNITEPKKRKEMFGQTDHVRKYGLDFKNRLEKLGFKVQIYIPNKNEKIRYSLKEERIYCCIK